jgi:hypothetical protein
VWLCEDSPQHVRAAFAFSHLFACIQGFEGVNEKHELIRLRREHDSTGLRAKPKLNTPLLRCASPENTRAVSVASEMIQQNGKMRSHQAPHFILRVVALRRRAVAVMVVTGAMLAFDAATLPACSFGHSSPDCTSTKLARTLQSANYPSHLD